MSTRKLIKYDEKYVSTIFALNNNGVLCYLNSLIQSLLSCPTFNFRLLKNKDKYAGTPHPANEYINLYEKHTNGKINQIDDAYAILRELYSFRKSLGSDHLLSLSRQEDIHEGLILFLDTLSTTTLSNHNLSVDMLFHNRYKCEINCRKCGDKRIPGDKNYEEPPEVVIDLSEESPSIQNITSKESMENHILRNIQIPRDYKCEKCGAQNTFNPTTGKIDNNIYQMYNLVRLSEIVVLLFKKYKKKHQIYFPQTMEFKSTSGILKYKIVAQVEHYGNMFGGHYITKCLRKKPSNFYLERKQNYEKLLEIYINKLKTLLVNYSENDESAKQNLINKIKEIKKNMNENDINKNDSYGVFLFNDSYVQYCSEGFIPTKDSYMVFYHLYE